VDEDEVDMVVAEEGMVEGVDTADSSWDMADSRRDTGDNRGTAVTATGVAADVGTATRASTRVVRDTRRNEAESEEKQRRR
jgi:hypothetical protein